MIESIRDTYTVGRVSIRDTYSNMLLHILLWIVRVSHLHGEYTQAPRKASIKKIVQAYMEHSINSAVAVDYRFGIVTCVNSRCSFETAHKLVFACLNRHDN